MFGSIENLPLSSFIGDNWSLVNYIQVQAILSKKVVGYFSIFPCNNRHFFQKLSIKYDVRGVDLSLGPSGNVSRRPNNLLALFADYHRTAPADRTCPPEQDNAIIGLLSQQYQEKHRNQRTDEPQNKRYGCANPKPPSTVIQAVEKDEEGAQKKQKRCQGERKAQNQVFPSGDFQHG